MQNRQKRYIRRKAILLKRRLRCLGAWSVLILAFVLTGGIVVGIITGVKNVCDAYLKDQAGKNDGKIVMASVNKGGETDYDLQQTEKKRIEEAGDGVKDSDEAFNLQEDEGKNRERDSMQQERTANSTPNQEATLLVNKSVYLSTDYEVMLTTLKNGQQVAGVMYEDLKAMLTDGEKEVRASFLVSSGYRTAEKQGQLLEEEIVKNVRAGMNEEEARADALLTVAPAHFSEHETGLAVDIVSVANQRLDETQELTAANRWLRENCQEYGFILRYPKGKEEVTGFAYESWHFRYVGKEAAKEIMEQGITLEEYLDRDKN